MKEAGTKSGATVSMCGPIRKAFAEYFAHWGIRLPSSLSAGKGSIHQRGWSIDWLVAFASRKALPGLQRFASHDQPQTPPHSRERKSDLAPCRAGRVPVGIRVHGGGDGSQTGSVRSTERSRLRATAKKIR